MSVANGGATIAVPPAPLALSSHAKGLDNSKYKEFVTNFATFRQRVERDPRDYVSATHLTSMLLALSGSLSALKERKHDSLVAQLLAIRIWDVPQAVRDALVGVISNLVVANTAFVHTCLQMLVGSFTPPASPPIPEADLGPWVPSEQEVAVQACVLQALSKPTCHTPTTPVTPPPHPSHPHPTPVTPPPHARHAPTPRLSHPHPTPVTPPPHPCHAPTPARHTPTPRPSRPHPTPVTPPPHPSHPHPPPVTPPPRLSHPHPTPVTPPPHACHTPTPPNVCRQVLSLVPTAAPVIVELVARALPHKMRDRSCHCLFLSAMLSVAETRQGAPIKESLLTVAVEHLLSMDVEIRWEDIVDVPTGDDAEEGDSEEVDDIFEIEGMNDLDINDDDNSDEGRLGSAANAAAVAHGLSRGGWEGGAVAVAAPQGMEGVDAAEAEAAAAAATAAASGRGPVDQAASKQDSLMDIVFGHVGRRLEAGELRQVWATLLSVFESALLHTHRSKFTQYLLFHVASSDPASCAPSLLRLLTSRLKDARQPQITRSACAAYIASFLARSAFVPSQLVVDTLSEVASWCNEYAGGINSSSSSGNFPSLTKIPSSKALAAASDATATAGADLGMQDATARHQVFYAAVQAILYVLCYHLSGIMAPTAPGELQPGLLDASNSRLADSATLLLKQQVWPLLSHRLAPLVVCLPSVVAEFGQQATALGLMECLPLIPNAEQLRRALRPLEMFFPFDPYLLKRSSKWLRLKETYVRWRAGHTRGTPGSVSKPWQSSASRRRRGMTGGSDVGGASELGAASDIDAEHMGGDSELGDIVADGGGGLSSGCSSPSTLDSGDDSDDSEDYDAVGMTGMSVGTDSSLPSAADGYGMKNGMASMGGDPRVNAPSDRASAPTRPSTYKDHPHMPPLPPSERHLTGSSSLGGRGGLRGGTAMGGGYAGMKHERAESYGTGHGSMMMGVSYSPSNSASVGDRASPMGTSPVLVHYMPPPGMQAAARAQAAAAAGGRGAGPAFGGLSVPRDVSHVAAAHISSGFTPMPVTQQEGGALMATAAPSRLAAGAGPSTAAAAAPVSKSLPTRGRAM
ncbi:MAG: hypothetical protein WDW36_005886 [Sanguina aurantia]